MTRAAFPVPRTLRGRGRRRRLGAAGAMRQADPRLELWLVDLARCGPALVALERETPRLAADDYARTGAIRDRIARDERIAAHSALRIVLERAAGAGIRRRPLVRGQGGAPRLTCAPRFSLSHTRGFALIGLAASAAIGADVERARPVHAAQHRRDQICAVGAGLAGKPLPAAEPDRTFVQAWVRLEAFAKASGRGLAATLADLGLRGGRPRPAPERLEAAARRLALKAGLATFDLDLPPPLQGAVAAAVGVRPPLRPRRLPADRARLERLLARPRRRIVPGCGACR